MKKLPDPSSGMITLSARIAHKSSQTLLEFLSHRYRYHSPEEWGELIGEGRVIVNDRPASQGQPLRAGDVVSYSTAAWKEPEVNPNYRVVHEDGALLALSKPAPLPVHAIGAYFQNTLMHLLRKDRPEAKDYHLVHRLDAETSGLLLLAKDKKHLGVLQKQWQTRQVQKSYLAIVFGEFKWDSHLVEAPIGRKEGSQVRMKLAVDEKGKPSATEFKLVERRNGFSLLEARILTGRTHQIRVHLEHLGYPLVGDKLYSGKDETFLHFHENGWTDWLKGRVLLPRAALHAWRLEFHHPVSGERVRLEDSLPPDLVSFWGSVKKSDGVSV